MTEYQKKKLIDLVLVVTGIVLVGLFLRTQLSNPIILEVDDIEAQETVAGDYVIGNLIEDEEDLSLPEYVDVRASEIRIGQDYIDILITLRGLPKTLPIESNALRYSVGFDVNRDGLTSDDVIITHEYSGESATANSAIAIDDETQFETKIIQMDEDIESILGAGEAVIDENILYIRIPNSSMLEIDEKTPFKVWVSNNQNDTINEDKMPSNSGE